MKILMVCLGNICRSPLAEGILQHKANEKGLDWQIDSAGTGDWHVGSLPDSRSIKTGLAHGIDLRKQRARQFKYADFERFDLIVVMDTSNRSNVLAQARSAADRAKVRLILDYIAPNEDLNVPDPYYDDDGFEAVFELLDEACEKMMTCL